MATNVNFSTLSPTTPQSAPDVASLATVLTKEIEALALEISTSVYGCDWQTAIDEALATFRDLFNFAASWDDAACIQGNLDACPF